MEACIKKLNTMNAFQEQVRTYAHVYTVHVSHTNVIQLIYKTIHTVHVAAWYSNNLHMQMACVRYSVIAKAWMDLHS